MDDQEMIQKRDWLEARLLKETRRPYVRLPDGHPDFDAEDLPWPWSWLVEAFGAAVLVAILVAVTVFIAYPIRDVLPNFLEWLSAAISGL